MEELCAHAGASKLSRDQLATILPPEPTETFKPISHAELIHNVLDGLSNRASACASEATPLRAPGERDSPK